MSQQSLVLFIHGLGGNAEETWGKFPLLVLSDRELAGKYRTATYEFPTAFFTLPARSDLEPSW